MTPFILRLEKDNYLINCAQTHFLLASDLVGLLLSVWASAAGEAWLGAALQLLLRLLCKSLIMHSQYTLCLKIWAPLDPRQPREQTFRSNVVYSMFMSLSLVPCFDSLGTKLPVMMRVL